MTYLVKEDLKSLTDITSQSNISSANAQEIYDIIERYFNEHDRDQSFMITKANLSERFGEILEHFDFNNGILF